MESNWIVNASYKDVCDPRCINGCPRCVFPCYNGGVNFEYFDVSNKSHIFVETIYNCIGSYQNLVEKLEACCSVGRASPLWYNSSNPKDYRKTNDPGPFVNWVIAFPIVTVVAIATTVVGSLMSCNKI